MGCRPLLKDDSVSDTENVPSTEAERMLRSEWTAHFGPIDHAKVESTESLDRDD